MSLVNTLWLEENINKVKVIDSSWHMPQTSRNGHEEYKKEHIKNAIFFDLDKNSKQNTDLPHMLTDQENWSKIVSDMGINNDDEIVVYDNSEVISSCRCWYNFIYYGHDFNKVHILDGGFEKWKLENKFTTDEIPEIKKTNYLSKENKDMVKNIDEINENIKSKIFTVVDARSKERFEGKAPEPRKNTRSGSIENSFCLPFKELINSDKTFIDKIEIHKKFTKINKEMNDKIVFSCGSGVTACVLALAYSLVNTKYTPTIYDGSWSEYGKI